MFKPIMTDKVNLKPIIVDKDYYTKYKVSSISENSYLYTPKDYPYLYVMESLIYAIKEYFKTEKIDMYDLRLEIYILNEQDYPDYIGMFANGNQRAFHYNLQQIAIKPKLRTEIITLLHEFTHVIDCYFNWQKNMVDNNIKYEYEHRPHEIKAFYKSIDLYYKLFCGRKTFDIDLFMEALETYYERFKDIEAETMEVALIHRKAIRKYKKLQLKLYTEVKL